MKKSRTILMGGLLISGAAVNQQVLAEEPTLGFNTKFLSVF